MPSRRHRLNTRTSTTTTITHCRRLPPEIIDNVIDHLHSDQDTLISCAQVSREWVPASRYHLFHTIHCVHRSKLGEQQHRPIMWVNRRRSLVLADLIDSDLCTFRASIRHVGIHGRAELYKLGLTTTRVPQPDAEPEEAIDGWLSRLLTVFTRLAKAESLLLSLIQGKDLTAKKDLFVGAFSEIHHLSIPHVLIWTDKGFMEFVLSFSRLNSFTCETVGGLIDIAKYYPPSIPIILPPGLNALEVGTLPHVLETMEPLMPQIQCITFQEWSGAGVPDLITGIDRALRLCGPTLSEAKFLCQSRVYIDYNPNPINLSHNRNLQRLEFETNFSFSSHKKLNVPGMVASIQSNKPITISFVIHIDSDRVSRQGLIPMVIAHHEWAGIDRALEGKASNPDYKAPYITLDLKENYAGKKAPSDIGVVVRRKIGKLMPFAAGRGLLRVSHQRLKKTS